MIMSLELSPRFRHSTGTVITFVLFILSVSSRTSLVQSQSLNCSTNALQDDYPMATMEYPDGVDVVHAEQRANIPEPSASEWHRWNMEKRIKYFNEKMAEGIETIINEDIPALERQSQKAKTKTPHTDIDKRLGQLKEKTPDLRKVGKEIKEGKHNPKFKVTKVKTKKNGRTVTKVKINKDFNNKINKLVTRSTRTSEQHAERGLAAVKSLRTGLTKLIANWGEEGKEWENMADIMTMCSGILAVIPSPHTKGLAVFLEFAAMIFGLAAPSAEDQVRKDIRDAVDLITAKFDRTKVVTTRANLIDMNRYWHFVMITLDNSNMTILEWNNYRQSDLILSVHDEVKEVAEIKGWIENNLEYGDSASMTTEMLKNYWRLVSMQEEIYTRIIHTMPTDEENGNDNIQEEYIDARQALLERTVNFFNDHVVEFTRSSVNALKGFYPPARDFENIEFFNFMNGITYDTSDGEVFGVDNFPDPPRGTYYLEPASIEGNYLRIASDWDYTESVKLGYTWDVTDYFETLLLGTTITLDYEQKKNEKTRIIINDSPRDEPYPGARTLTFAEGGKITYLTQFTFQQKNFRQEYRMYPIRQHTTQSTTPIFAETSTVSHLTNAGITVNKFFRVIPLKQEPGDRGLPVLIGDANGDSFLTLTGWTEKGGGWGRHSRYPMYLKPFKEETIGSGASSKKRVDIKQVFYLIK